MKVFLSWSGERSKQVATLLDEWLRCVLQAIRPWISTKDIDRGSLWFSEIQDQLQDVTTGIICLTQENKEKPWILFEAGALAKGLSNSRVCTLLIDLEPHDIRDPLAQFNHTKPDQGGIYALVHTLNNRLGDNRLDPAILTKVLDTYWAQFEERFQKIIVDTPVTEKPKARPEKDILSEILEHTRTLNSRLNRLEENQSTASHDKTSKKIRTYFDLDSFANTTIGLFKEGKSIKDISISLSVPPHKVINTLIDSGLIAPPLQPED
ncbi:toll/interleukin-1 receptor domain-containing protein [Aeromonas hydrophila]|uniref:toll/interleukin-1 receptor domain-containing protein n=1 Tax=Aeromonas hydrophila TaxID=644 RepID=UPI0021E63816|nr:toll/interleukin-1 receptor domain-containing protein [Aeromonas hydrophila]MCV3276754.1 toll/interleukin-1 receptor domain-containing protein [Aeromonas hydrophila]